MPRSIQDLEAHAERLADRFESDEWDEIPGKDAAALRGIAAAVQAVAASERAVADAVAEARSAGHSWGPIALMLGTSRQAAQRRYGAS